MNRKQILTLIVVLAILGGAGWLASKKKQSPATRAGGSALTIGGELLPDFPLNNVAGISIVQATQQVTLAKSADAWTVKERGNYPANFGSISDLLRKVWEIKVTKPVTVPASRLPALELVSPDEGGSSGTRVEFKNASGDNLHTLLLGAEHMREAPADSQFGGGSFPDGRYVMVDADLKRIALVSDPLSSVNPDPSSWVSKDFFKVEKIKSIEVTAREATNSWKITRPTESGTWELAGPGEGETLDPSKVGSANYLLSSPYFNDVMVNPEPAQTGLDEPRRVVIETFGNFKYELELGRPQPGDVYPLKVAVSAELPEKRTPAEDEKEEDKERLDKEFNDNLKTQKEKLAKEKALGNWTYTVSKWTVDFLLKNRSELLKAPEEASVAEVGPAPAPADFTLPDPVPAPTPTPAPVPSPAVVSPAVQAPELPEPVKPPVPDVKPVPPAPEEAPQPPPAPEPPAPQPEPQG